MTVSKETFGKTSDGKEVSKYTLSNENNMTVSFLDYGAIIQSVKVPDRNGKIDDVVLGYDDLASYESNPNFFGAFLGRHANRIAFAYFELNGEEYKLEKNDGGRNNLHGGSPGYYKVMYDAEIGEDCVTFSRLSPDGEQGFPGNLDVKVTYRLTNENELKIEYNTKALDKDTLCNLSNHSYFNLKGHNNGDITDHKVMIKANAITETNRNSIPTGELMSVEGTPFDFRNPALVGDGLKSDNQYIKNSNGYDHNFVLDKEDGVFDKVAEITEDTSGRKMEVYTDLPGLQFYTGNYVSGTGKEGAVYGARSGMCFETQFFPDSINQPNFKQCILRAGQEFNSTTIYKFSV
nr:aldose epimerase family protein [Eubacterium xylanophilum]